METIKNICSLICAIIKGFFITIKNMFAEIISHLFKRSNPFSIEDDYKETKNDFKNLGYNISNFFKNFKLSNYTRKQKTIFSLFIIMLLVSSTNDIQAISQKMLLQTCNVIYIDGQKILNLDSNINVDYAETIDKYMTNKQGVEIEITSDITSKKARVFKSNITGPTDALALAAAKVSYDVYCAELSIDGDFVLYSKSITELSNVLNELKQPYQDSKYSQVTFKEKIEIEEKFAPHNEVLSQDEIKNVLEQNKTEKEMYKISEGDTLENISIQNQVSIDDILYLNPDIDENSKLLVGDNILIKEPVPMITVRAYERIAYNDVDTYKIEKIENKEEQNGYEKIISEGVNGSKTVVANVVYDNGVEIDRIIINEEVTSEPVNEVVEIGTKNAPDKKAVDSFIFPCRGRIINSFTFDDAEHKGIDIANEYETPIVASDGGRVSYVGHASDGYGNLVVIDHENGYSTYYANNSEIQVIVGQMVAQGEQISKMGSTGSATENSCHFEIRQNGVPKNPFDYLTY